MICAICKKTEEETTLYPGILRAEMVNVCEECAEDQKIPIIKKPSHSQLSQADRHYSVRERLDRMQGRQIRTSISDEQMITQGNLAKLRSPPKSQSHPDALENYNWTLKMARRRTKMTTSQLAKKINTESYIIQEIEKGILPQNFQEIFLKLEALLGIKILKSRPEVLSFTRKSPDKEKEILAAVAEKMKHPESDLEEDENDEEIIKVQEKIEKEELKLSDRKNLSNITLNDLIDRKRAREKYKQKIQEDEMIGDEIDLDEL